MFALLLLLIMRVVETRKIGGVRVLAIRNKHPPGTPEMPQSLSISTYWQRRNVDGAELLFAVSRPLLSLIGQVCVALTEQHVVLDR